jgi:hypothetical protein
MRLENLSESLLKMLKDLHYFQCEATRAAGEMKLLSDLTAGVYDVCQLAEFLRQTQPGMDSPSGERLVWEAKLNLVILKKLEKLLEAQEAAIRAQQIPPTVTNRQPSDIPPHTETHAAATSPTAGLEPGLPGSSSQPVPSTGPPGSGGYLGVIVDKDDQFLRREGWPGEADLSGSTLSWHLALTLLKRKNRCSSLGHLHEVWKAHGREEDPEKKTIEDAISRLRRRIRPLGLTVVHKTGLGYRLEELPSEGERESGRE